MYNHYNNTLINDYFSLEKELQSEEKFKSEIGSENPCKNPDFRDEEYDAVRVSDYISNLDWDDIVIDISDDDDDWGEQIVPDCNRLLEKTDKRNFTYTECKEHYEVECNGDVEKIPTFNKCAWYSSYHYGKHNWGIHMKESCIRKRARYIWKHNAPYTTTHQDAYRSAFLYTFSHELFHFITDQAATVLELILRDPTLYKKYMSSVYLPSFQNPPFGALEESLANRYRYGRYQFYKMNKYLAFRMMKNQPIGYNSFDKYLGDYKEARRTLINYVVAQSKNPHKRIGIETVFDLINPRLYTSGNKIPIWMHYNKKGKRKIRFK